MSPFEATKCKIRICPPACMTFGHCFSPLLLTNWNTWNLVPFPEAFLALPVRACTYTYRSCRWVLFYVNTLVSYHFKSEFLLCLHYTLNLRDKICFTLVKEKNAVPSVFICFTEQESICGWIHCSHEKVYISQMISHT